MNELDLMASEEQLYRLLFYQSRTYATYLLHT